MKFDEIDGFVDDLFRQQRGEDALPRPGDMLVYSSGDWRIDRIDQIIQDAYNEAMWWHNNRISEGADPRSGLRNLPYIPWDERIDGVAAMAGNGDWSTSVERNGTSPRNTAVKIIQKAVVHRGIQYVFVNGRWVAAGAFTEFDAGILYDARNKGGLSCGELLLIAAVAIGLLLFMMIAS